MAETARKSGNEGRARVCARRATGHVIEEYFRRRGLSAPTTSAYGRIQFLISLPDVPPKVREIAEHFLVRITPDHKLPTEADLIAHTRWLVSTLLEEDL